MLGDIIIKVVWVGEAITSTSVPPYSVLISPDYIGEKVKILIKCMKIHIFKTYLKIGNRSLWAIKSRYSWSTHSNYVIPWLWKKKKKNFKGAAPLGILGFFVPSLKNFKVWI